MHLAFGYTVRTVEWKEYNVIRQVCRLNTGKNNKTIINLEVVTCKL